MRLAIAIKMQWTMRNVINNPFIVRIPAIFIASILIFLVCTPLRSFPAGENFTSTYISAPIGFILYYILTYKLCTRYAYVIRPTIILITIISGFVFLQLPVRIMDFTGTAVTLPEQFIHLTGIILGFLSYRKYIKRWKAIVIGTLFYIIVFPIFLPLYMNLLDFGSTTGDIREKTIVPNFKIINEKGDTLSLYDLKASYIIFDIWHNSCQSCFKAFPKVQELHKRLKFDNDIKIYALNYPLDKISPFLFMKEKGYDIPILELLEKEKKTVTKYLNIRVFPTVIIINKNHQLIFRGDINRAKKYINHILEK